MSGKCAMERLGLATATPPPQPEGRDDAHGKHAVFSLRLERMNGNGSGMLYGTLMGVLHDPSNGIQLVYEGAYAEKWGGWKYGVWLVEVKGPRLEAVYQFICESRQTFVRETEDVRIEVKPFKLPGYGDK